MGNNNAEVIIKTRSSVDRRKLKDRRSFLKTESIAHYPERRVSMIGRRVMGDRRGLVAQYYEYFLKKKSLIFTRKYFGN